MKILKYLTITIIFLFMINLYQNVYAMEDMSGYEKLYCPTEPFDLSNPVNRGIQTVTGINFLASKIAENEIKKGILSFATGDIDVKVGSYSATDSKNGKFKSIKFKGKNLNANCVYISELSVKTKCKYMHFDLNSNPIKLLKPMVIDFDAKLSENDLNKMLKTNSFKKEFFKMKYNSEELKLLEISKPRVIIRDGKINFLVDIKAPFIRTFMLKATSSIEIKDNRFNLSHLRIGTNSHNFSVKGAHYLISLLNPMDFAQICFEKQGFKILLKNVRIDNNSIIISGTVFVKKS